MVKFGITENGFVLKRLDDALDELHNIFSEGFGIDTRLINPQSFLNVLITTLGNKTAEFWELAQDSYYAKYPSTAEGINLDNAIQYGGIRRAKSRKTIYPIHCTGKDGTLVREGVRIATNTSPKITLSSASEFKITRDNCNSLRIKIATVDITEYSVVINNSIYVYVNKSDNEEDVLSGLKDAITDDEFNVYIIDGLLHIEDKTKERSNKIILTNNLTTESVSTIASFVTDNYGKVEIPDRLISEILTIISGFESITNIIQPTYGREQETDVELRHSYIRKSAIRASCMIDNIISMILNNIPNVVSVDGYENPSDVIDSDGRPPHSIEIIVDGGDETLIAQTILNGKAGGIQTYGNIVIPVTTKYNHTLDIRFNRPELLYVWLKVKLYAKDGILPINYSALVVESIMLESEKYAFGNDMISQMFNESIYNNVSGVTYIDIKAAVSENRLFEPSESDYTMVNVYTTARQKILIAKDRIEVELNENI